MTAGVQRFLKPDGFAIHAVDHVHRGKGDIEHLAKLRLMVASFGLSTEELDRLLEGMALDTETYYLSAESHNRWRSGVPYDEFPMRVCVSIQLVSEARAMTKGQDLSLSSFQIAGRLSDADWVDFLTGSRPEALDGLQPPIVPDPRVQEAYVGSSGDSAMREAGAFYSRIRAILDEHRVSERTIGRVLDFGCGWGRISRFFLRHCLPGDLVGVDIDEECIAFCREAMPYCTFFKCESSPPLPFGLASFDVVVAYSVFSHLAEDASRAWLAEFSRLVKPGGFLFFTTLKIEHLAVWAELAIGGNEHHKRALAAAGFSLAGWQRRAASGDLLFVPTGGGGVRDNSFYGEAIVTPGYLERHAPALGFSVLAFLSDTRLPQSFVALRRSVDVPD